MNALLLAAGLFVGVWIGASLAVWLVFQGVKYAIGRGLRL